MTSLQGDPCPPPVITVSGRDDQMLITITLAITIITRAIAIA